MENYNIVPDKGTFGGSVEVVNQNFLLTQQEMEVLQNKCENESARAIEAENSIRQLYNNLQQSQPVPVTALPATGEAGKIYRLAGSTSYADYMYHENDLTTPIKMAEYDNAIDDKPTVGSDNLVKSGGVSTSMISNWITHKTKINGNRELVADENFYTTPLIPFGGGSFILNASGITSNDNLRIVVYAADGVTILNGWVIEPNVSRSGLSDTYKYIRFTGKYGNNATLVLNSKTVWDKTVNFKNSPLLETENKVRQFSQSILDAYKSLGYIYGGNIIPTSSPIVSTEKIFYTAFTEGTYTNFSGIVIKKGEACLIRPVFSGGQIAYWYKESILKYLPQEGYVFMGYAVAGTEHGTPQNDTYKEFYLSAVAGTYPNFLDIDGNAITNNGNEVFIIEPVFAQGVFAYWHKAQLGLVNTALLNHKITSQNLICGILDRDGNVVDNSDYYVTDYIPFTGGIFTWHTSEVNNNAYTLAYDANYNIINRWIADAATVQRTITDSGYAYIRASFKFNNIGDIFINETTKVFANEYTKDELTRAKVDYAVQLAVSEISPEIEQSVSDWLGEHPEATTTVQDDSITAQKLATTLKSLQYFKTEEGDGANTAIGDDCGAMSGLANRSNIGIGHRTLLRNSTGIKNITVGNDNMSSDNSPENALTGERNTSMGYHALYRESAGSDNTAMGAESLDDNTSGSKNTGCGAYSLQRNSKGDGNTAVGFRALCGGSTSVVYDSNKTYGGNVAVGAYALEQNTSGNGNTAIGFHAMENKNYSDCVAIGRYSGASIDGNGQFMISNSDTTKQNAMMYGEFNKTNLAQQKLRINAGVFMLPNLPTSDPQVAGALWNDGGVLKISSGN